uniref:Uncharacterized protein n=1 Tax=Rhizophora mucronata TaxID=61149 RepID=A0A2P2PBS6_RHIMU
MHRNVQILGTNEALDDVWSSIPKLMKLALMKVTNF